MPEYMVTKTTTSTLSNGKEIVNSKTLIQTDNFYAADSCVAANKGAVLFCSKDGSNCWSRVTPSEYQMMLMYAYD